MSASSRIAATRLRRKLVWLFEARSSAAAVMHTLVARFGVLGINLATGLIIARVLAPTGRGEQAAMTLWPTVICGLLTFGLPTALRYYAARERDRGAELLSASLLYSMLLGFIGVVAGVLFIPHWLSNYDTHVIRFAQWLMLLAPPIMIAWILQGFLEARGNFRQSNAIVYIPPAATLAALVVLAILHRLTPYSSSLAYAVPPLLVTVWRLIALRHLIRLPTGGFRTTTRRLFSYGMGAYGVNVLSTLSSQIDKALVVKFLTPASLGAYTVGVTVAALPGIVAQSLTIVLLPRASAMEYDAALALVARAARLTLAGTLAGSIVLGLVVPKALPLLYGHSFAVSVEVTEILFLQVTIAATVSILAQAFLAVGRPAFLNIHQALGLASTFPFMLFLIPRFGVNGAALAALLSAILRMAFMLASYPIFLKRPPPNLILRPADIAFVLATLRAKPRAEET